MLLSSLYVIFSADFSFSLSPAFLLFRYNILDWLAWVAGNGKTSHGDGGVRVYIMLTA